MHAKLYVHLKEYPNSPERIPQKCWNFILIINIKLTNNQQNESEEVRIMNSLNCGVELQIIHMKTLIDPTVVTLEYAFTCTLDKMKFGAIHTDVCKWRETPEELPPLLKGKFRMVCFYKQEDSEPTASAILNDEQFGELEDKTDSCNEEEGVDRVYSGGITVLKDYSQEEKDCIEKWLNLKNYESEHSFNNKP